MTDSLYIDTVRTRDAVAHLRTMHSNGEDLINDIRIAATLAELADSIANDFDVVSESMAELASVLDERSTLAENGYIMTNRSSATQLAGLSQALWGYKLPTTDRLFPEIGPRTTGVLETLAGATAPGEADTYQVGVGVDGVDVSVTVDGDSSLGRFGGWLDDRFDDAVDWIGDQPIAPSPLAPFELSALGEAGDAVHTAVDWYVSEYGDPTALPVLPPPLTPFTDFVFEQATVEASVSLGVISVGLAYTEVGGKPQIGLLGGAGPGEGLGAEARATYVDEAPRSGWSESYGGCFVACGGATVDSSGIHPYVGIGTPQPTVTKTYTEWFELGWSSHD